VRTTSKRLLIDIIGHHKENFEAKLWIGVLFQNRRRWSWRQRVSKRNRLSESLRPCRQSRSKQQNRTTYFILNQRKLFWKLVK
jgi:hypothetical protein